MALNGTYKVTTRSAMGVQEGEFIFHTEGDVLTGKVVAMGIEVDLLDGKVSDTAFSGAVEGEAPPMGKMRMEIAGTIDGDKIKGTMKAKMGGAMFDGVKISD